MSGISDDMRRLYADAMTHNLQFIPDNLNENCVSTLREMAETASQPYNPANFRFQGDTVDRHRNSPVGNLCESIVVYVLCQQGVDPTSIDICRDYATQVTDKIDIIGGSETYQVKKAKVGSSGGLFVSKQDMEGQAQHLVYVDENLRKIYTVTRQPFFAGLLAIGYDEEDLARPTQTWKYAYDRSGTIERGWWIDDLSWGERRGLFTCVDVPSYLATPVLTTVER